MRWTLVLVLAGCACSQSAGPAGPATATGAATGTAAAAGTATATGSATAAATATGTATATATGSATAADAGTAGPGLGEECGANDRCGAGSCVSYYGIAGARGPQFKSCEIKCRDDAACPSDRKCVTIADGPGRVCR